MRIISMNQTGGLSSEGWNKWKWIDDYKMYYYFWNGTVSTRVYTNTADSTRRPSVGRGGESKPRCKIFGFLPNDSKQERIGEI